MYFISLLVLALTIIVIFLMFLSYDYSQAKKSAYCIKYEQNCHLLPKRAAHRLAPLSWVARQPILSWRALRSTVHKKKYVQNKVDNGESSLIKV